MSPPTFGFGSFSFHRKSGNWCGRLPRNAPGIGAAPRRVCLLPRGNHPHAAGAARGPSQHANGSAATRGNEVKWTQTAGNVAKVSGFESSRACGFCNPRLLKQGFNLPLFAIGWEKKNLMQHKPRCYNTFGCTSLVTPKGLGQHPLGVQSWPGIFQSPLSLYHWPCLLSQHALKSSSESLSINMKELLDSEEHISSAQRTSTILSKLKQSCAMTLGFKNRCPAGKEKVKLLLFIKRTFIFLAHWIILIDKPWCYSSESSKRLYL